MKRPVGEIIWITGASSGLGQQLALKLAELENHVLISGRNREVLESMARQRPNLTPVVADLADPQSADRLRVDLRQHVEYLDRMILNAGTCEYFDVDEPDWSMMERVMQVNYLGTVRSLQAGLPLLRLSSGARHIVAMGSQASRVAFPRAQAYGASKAAVSYFMEAMAVDLARENIAVTTIEPGFVDTPLTRRNDFPMPFMLSAEEAADLIIKKLPGRCRTLRFPRRLSVFLALGSACPALWHKLVAPRLVREKSSSSYRSKP